jgi:mono/diheme cytochrome c family protein
MMRIGVGRASGLWQTLRPAALRAAFGVAACALVMAGVFSTTGQARQARTVDAGVYSTAQAQRGAALYKAQCVACHGEQLEGLVGPMLAGADFVTAWGGRSMGELVDKIQKTMPLQAPGSLSQEQSIDIAAYMLQVSKFKPGQGALAGGQLAQVTFPAARAAAAPVATGSVNVPPVANLAQYMRGVTFPNANIIFNTQVKDPGATKPQNPVPFDYPLWGNTVYYGWQAADQAALALIETTPLFLMPGRRCENGRPVPLQNKDYQQWTQDLITLSREIYKTVQTRNQDAVAALSERLNDTCANCHKRYRDVGTAEGGGLGTDRCKS